MGRELQLGWVCTVGYTVLQFWVPLMGLDLG